MSDENKDLESTIDALNVSENAIPSDWVEILRSLSESAVEPGANSVAKMASAQVGKTEILMNYLLEPCE